MPVRFKSFGMEWVVRPENIEDNRSTSISLNDHECRSRHFSVQDKLGFGRQGGGHVGACVFVLASLGIEVCDARLDNELREISPESGLMQTG